MPHWLGLEALMLLHHDVEDLLGAEDGHGSVHQHECLLWVIDLLGLRETDELLRAIRLDRCFELHHDWRCWQLWLHRIYIFVRGSSWRQRRLKTRCSIMRWRSPLNVCVEELIIRMVKGTDVLLSHQGSCCGQNGAIRRR